MKDKKRCVLEEKNAKVKMKWTHLTIGQDWTAKGILLQSNGPKRRM